MTAIISEILIFCESSRKLDNVVSVTALRSSEYDRKAWKRSREKAGFLIQRISGYDLKKSTYGVQYLGVVSRGPDRTSAERSAFPFAGFMNWEALEEIGHLTKERNHNRKRKSAG